MIDKDLKQRKIASWYNIVQDRASWRRIVNGESGDVVMKGKGRKSAVERSSVDGLARKKKTTQLECPKCGKVCKGASRSMRKGGGWGMILRQQ